LQHVSEALQYDVASSCSILIFAISLFGCALALDARGRRPACPPTPLHAPALRSRGWIKKILRRTFRTKQKPEFIDSKSLRPDWQTLWTDWI